MAESVEAVVVMGESAAAERLRVALSTVANAAYAVLLVGDRGVGKSFIAQWIHSRRRPDGNYVELNCASVAIELRRGTSEASGGADVIRSIVQPAINRSANGTLVLEGIDDLPIRGTALLFSALADRGSMTDGQGATGSTRTVIATSTKPFEFTAALPSTQFVQRTHAVVLEVPPLRDRLDDLPVWIDAFRTRVALEAGIKSPRFHPVALNLLRAYDWPGNILELEGIVRRLTLSASNGQVTKSDVLQLLPRLSSALAPNKVPATALRRHLDAVSRELEYLRRAAISANPIWQGRQFEVEEDYCFVLMPFSDSSDIQRVFRNHVRPVIERAFRLRCERADDIYGIAGVMQSVWEGINRSRLVIAELTGRNPNVFYELGIAHTLGKPVVMMSQTIDDVPADLRHLRCLIYEYKPDAIQKFEVDLQKTIASALSMTAADFKRKLSI